LVELDLMEIEDRLQMEPPRAEDVRRLIAEVRRLQSKEPVKEAPGFWREMAGAQFGL
jgi:hypothetical protein